MDSFGILCQFYAIFLQFAYLYTINLQRERSTFQDNKKRRQKHRFPWGQIILFEKGSKIVFDRIPSSSSASILLNVYSYPFRLYNLGFVLRNMPGSYSEKNFDTRVNWNFTLVTLQLNAVVCLNFLVEICVNERFLRPYIYTHECIWPNKKKY